MSYISNTKSCHCLSCCNCKPSDIFQGNCDCHSRTPISVSSLDKGLNDFKKLSIDCKRNQALKIQKTNSLSESDGKTLTVKQCLTYPKRVNKTEGETSLLKHKDVVSNSNHAKLSNLPPLIFKDRIDVCTFY